MKNNKEINNLKKKIKKKFGTYSNFTRIAGIDRYEFQRDFLCKNQVPDELFNDFSFAYEKFDYSPKRPVLNAEKRGWIKDSIQELGGVIDFCEKEGFSKDTVFQIISGYYELITPNIQKLIDVITERMSGK